jgi:hypothetical protein
MLWNFGSTIRKTWFWAINQVISRLECIGNEIINNLTSRKMVYVNVVQNVGKVGEHQNDQISTQKFLAFSGGEYSESNEFLGANENDVESLPNLENMRQREASPIRRSS